MFEGTEKEGALGSGGKYVLDVDGKGVAKAEITWGESGVKAGLVVSVDVVEILEMLAKKSDNTVDDSIVAMVKMALGRA